MKIELVTDSELIISCEEDEIQQTIIGDKIVQLFIPEYNCTVSVGKILNLDICHRKDQYTIESISEVEKEDGYVLHVKIAMKIFMN